MDTRKKKRNREQDTPVPRKEKILAGTYSQSTGRIFSIKAKMRDWILIVLLTLQLVCMAFILAMQFRIIDKIISVIPREITFNYTDGKPDRFIAQGGK